MVLSFIADELSVAEITLNETERRVDNLRKELTALNYKVTTLHVVPCVRVNS